MWHKVSSSDTTHSNGRRFESAPRTTHEGQTHCIDQWKWDGQPQPHRPMGTGRGLAASQQPPVQPGWGPKIGRKGQGACASEKILVALFCAPNHEMFGICRFRAQKVIFGPAVTGRATKMTITRSGHVEIDRKPNPLKMPDRAAAEADCMPNPNPQTLSGDRSCIIMNGSKEGKRQMCCNGGWAIRSPPTAMSTICRSKGTQSCAVQAWA